jgi:hypothetical protein
MSMVYVLHSPNLATPVVASADGRSRFPSPRFYEAQLISRRNLLQWDIILGARLPYHWEA